MRCDLRQDRSCPGVVLLSRVSDTLEGVGKKWGLVLLLISELGDWKVEGL